MCVNTFSLYVSGESKNGGFGSQIKTLIKNHQVAPLNQPRLHLKLVLVTQGQFPYPFIRFQILFMNFHERPAALYTVYSCDSCPIIVQICLFTEPKISDSSQKLFSSLWNTFEILFRENQSIFKKVSIVEIAIVDTLLLVLFSHRPCPQVRGGIQNDPKKAVRYTVYHTRLKMNSKQLNHVVNFEFKSIHEIISLSRPFQVILCTIRSKFWHCISGFLSELYGNQNEQSTLSSLC